MEVSGWFLAWIVTTQCVNLAFYLTITRATCGWIYTVGSYLVVYLLPLHVCIRWMNPLLHGAADGSVGALASGFALFFGLWGCLTMMLTRGAQGRSLFAVLVCGVHQVGAVSLGLLAINRFPSVAWGEAVGCVLMAAMGVLLICRVLPRVARLGAGADWRKLNLTAVMNLTLLYVTGIWPCYVPGGDWRAIVVFAVANAVAIVYFPVALALAEKTS